MRQQLPVNGIEHLVCEKKIVETGNTHAHCIIMENNGKIKMGVGFGTGFKNRFPTFLLHLSKQAAFILRFM